MTDEQVITLIEKEFQEKTFGVTEQYLEIHAPIYINNKLQIVRIDRDRDKFIIAYLPVIDERFYFAVYIDEDLDKLINIGTEPDHRVYFLATSENFSETELKAMCSLSVDESWNIGDLKKNGRSAYNFSALKIMPNSEPDEFEDKLDKLLTYLETDKKGVSELVEKAEGYIQVAMDIHNGNGMIGGPSIKRESIARMHNLGLSIDFDLYVSGNSFR
ncbi:DUF4279 domain-containing protein [Pedobacter sp. KBS0701]|uniref:DUF4279 domain-containing protein n=1 Tax=Pedobacter sp. KBS0701 TaxID=2578106 RepID=UPI00110DF0E2|nr:DUF4279 domain-containing protein [Pedobacter sp. KBS0701]QDW26597.1 DUF4279 domain-containing protein [Pedobacter sp. KBS0701]